MKYHNAVGIMCLVSTTLFALPHLLGAEATQGVGSTQNLYFVEPGPAQQSKLYIDNSVVELQGQTVTWPMVGSDLTDVSLEEFRGAVLAARQAFENDPNKIVVSPDGPRGGLNIVYNVSNPPAGATAALESMATYIESVFDDSATVNINIGFAGLPPGVIGATSNNYAGAPVWVTVRSSLIDDMDYDDVVQDWLPTGSTIPVRYNYNSTTVTPEDRVWFSVANYNAAIGTYAVTAANMTFSTNFNFDYDPGNGISSGHMCFQSICAHETGHVLGFVSGADFRTYEMEALDIFRFQWTDGAGDYNPDTLPEFQTTPRLVWNDSLGTSSRDVISDVIEVEYRMEDGTPYQASHFAEGLVYACMEPTFSYGQTLYSDFYKEPDKVMFDAIGWDYVDTLTITYSLTINIIGNGSVTADPDWPVYPEGTVVTLTAYPDQGWEFDHWSGGASGPNNPTQITMDSDKLVNAHFVFVGIEENQAAHIEAAFLEAFPNPFSREVNISYSIGNITSVDARLRIYDATGELVKGFSNRTIQSTNHVVWDGRNDLGAEVPSGVYFLKLESEGFSETRRLLLVK